jgi:hypothetical protein
MRGNKMASTTTDGGNSHAQGTQASTAGARKLSGDSNRLRNNRFRNLYNPQPADSFDYGPPASQGTGVGGMTLGQQNGMFGNQQTNDMNGNTASNR